MTIDPHDLYRRWLAELWHGGFDALDELVDERFVGHWPTHDVEGRQALRETIEQTHAMFADLAFATEVGPLAEGDLICARWRGAERSDEGERRFFGHDLLRVADGRVREYWVATVVEG